jgi:hypothetical protein
MNKKGAMQLSINMIVILIIAVVILGLALGFINNMFGSMANQFDPDEPDAPGARASNTITMSRGTGITASAGEALTIKWQAFCNIEDDCNKVTLNEIDCGTTNTGILVKDQALEKDIAYGESVQILSILTIGSSAKGTYLCTATFTETGATLPGYSESLDFSLKVN